MKIWKGLSILSIVVGVVMLTFTGIWWAYLGDIILSMTLICGFLLLVTNLRFLLMRERAK